MTDTSKPGEPTRPAPVLNETRARQARFGRPVFWVLVASTVLAALALFVAWTFRAQELHDSNVNNGPSPSGTTFNAPNPPATAAPGMGPGQPRP